MATRQMAVAMQKYTICAARSLNGTKFLMEAMPRGPKGERRPRDVIGAAVIVGRIG